MNRNIFIQVFFIFSLLINRGFAVDGSGPMLVVKNPHNSGMFAVFASVLGSLDKFEKGYYSGIRVELDGLYLDPSVGSNWWEYYFEPINFSIGTPTSFEYVNSIEYGHEVIARGFCIGRKRANELIEKYIRVKPEIEEYVSDFVETEFKKKYVIGVHYRGTDKGCEYPLVPYETTLRKVLELMTRSGVSSKKIKIFVATDQADFLEYMTSRLPKNVIHNDFIRSPTQYPLHGSDFLFSSIYEKGRQALLDCLLLSKCDVLIRSPNSSLSIASCRFNIDQPQVIVRSIPDRKYDVY